MIIRPSLEGNKLLLKLNRIISRMQENERQDSEINSGIEQKLFLFCYFPIFIVGFFTKQTSPVVLNAGQNSKGS